MDTDGQAANLGIPAHPVCGDTLTQPQWLNHIVVAAKLGDLVTIPRSPPPNLLLWFVTDMQFNLLEIQP